MTCMCALELGGLQPNSDELQPNSDDLHFSAFPQDSGTAAGGGGEPETLMLRPRC